MKDDVLKQLVSLLDVAKSTIPKLEKLIVIPVEEPVVEEKKVKKSGN